MARNRSVAIRPLSDDQEMFLLTGAMLTRVHRDEEDEDVLLRLFGDHDAADAAWAQHRPRLLAEFPTAGRRAAGYWLCERGVPVPPVESQAAILRELGELSGREEQQLAEWRALTPEIPADLGIDHVTTITIDPIDHQEDDTHDIDGDTGPAPVSPRPAPADEAIATAEEEVSEAEEVPVMPPRILPVLLKENDVKRPRVVPSPWYGQPDVRGVQGWESHDG